MTLHDDTLRALTAEEAILSLLEDDWMTGMAILRRLEEIKGRRYDAGWLYPVLYRLEDRGILESKWLDGPPPRNRVYRHVPTASRS